MSATWFACSCCTPTYSVASSILHAWLQRLVLQVQPDRVEAHRPPVAVEARVLHVLKVRAELQPYRRPPECPRPLGAIVGLEDLLRSVVEPSVTEQESRAASCQVIAMRAGEAFDDEAKAHAIIFAPPAHTGELR